MGESDGDRWESAADFIPISRDPDLTPTENISQVPDKDTKQNDLPKSVLDYYLQLESLLTSSTFENDEEKQLLEEKCVDQIKEDGIIRILYHWDGSRIVERVLVQCSQEILITLGDLILPYTTEIACHNTASHVLELLIIRVIGLIYKSPDSVTRLLELAEGIFRKLCLNVKELIDNPHGSYTLRLSLQVLVGNLVEDEKKTKKRWSIGREQFFRISDPQNIHPTLRRILNKFTKRLVKEDISGLVYMPQGAPLVTVLLQLLGKTSSKYFEKLKSEISSLLGESESDYKEVDKYGPLPKMALDPQGSYVLQALLKVASKSEMEDMFTRYYESTLIPLSLHPIANYTVQSLIEHCPSSPVAQGICQKLFPLFEDLLAETATGVVISVINCARRFAVTSDISKILLQSFHIPEDQITFTFRCIMSLTTYDILMEKIEHSKKPTQSGKPRRDRFEGTLHGSLLAQGLFKLGEISLLEDGMCTLSEDHIVYLCNDKHASHAIQAFLSSLNIAGNVKHRFISTTLPVVDKLVTNPQGSHVFESLWDAADLELKSRLAQGLLMKEQVLKDNTYGAIIWKKCNLKSFKMGQKGWEASEKRKKRDLQEFRELINDENDSVSNLVIKKRKVKKLKAAS